MDLHRREDGVLCVPDANGVLVPVTPSSAPFTPSLEPEPEPEPVDESDFQLDLDSMHWSEIRDLCESLGLTNRPSGMSWKDYYLESQNA